MATFFSLVTAFILFVVLKLTGQIDWSWWWITSPLWIPFAMFGCFLVVAGVTGIFNWR